MLFILTIAAGFSADPVRCVATLTTPTAGCTLRDSITVTAGGRTEAAGARAARAALKEALERAAAELALTQPDALSKATAACTALADTAHVDCFPDPALLAPKYCFVTLDNPDCWDGDPIELEQVGWKVFDTGRQQMCAAVDARVVKQNYPDAAARRVKCAAACAGHTQVRCP